MKRKSTSNSPSVENISNKRLRLDVQLAQTNGVVRAKRFLNVHLHCIVSNLKNYRRCPSLETFLRTPMGKSPRWPSQRLRNPNIRSSCANPTNYLADKGFSALVVDRYQERKEELSS